MNNKHKLITPPTAKELNMKRWAEQKRREKTQKISAYIIFTLLFLSLGVVW